MRFPTSRIEKSLRIQGFDLIAGVDEAGCGALAGPVVAAAVILPVGRRPRVRDSKQISASRREELFAEITDSALSWGVGIVRAEEIDAQGIRPATLEAMRRAVLSLQNAVYVLVDAWRIPDLTIPQKGLIRGDQSEALIAAASILAKVTRDRYMREADLSFPMYNFAQHKGYGTVDHRRRIQIHGASPLHRKTFSWA